MQLTVELSPKISEQLSKAARIRGIEPSELVESLVAEYLPPVATPSTGYWHPRFKSAEEHIAAMDAVAEKNAHLPILSDSAFDRESIYKDSL